MFTNRKIYTLSLLGALACYSLQANSAFCQENGSEGISALTFIPYIFKSGEGGYKCYRIPAIVQSPRGTLIAFAEGRVNSTADHGNLDIVASRSTDGGKTWSDLIIVQDDGDNQCGNPAPVVDSATGRIFLISCGSNASEYAIMDGKATREVYIQHSDDDGLTWSKRRNITAQTKKHDWRWYATGPCSGIQIREGRHKGRLVIPANHSDADRQYKAHCIYSDDAGDTWNIGETAGIGSNESQIAETATDVLVQNMRMQTHGKGMRGIRTSHDGGATWTPLKLELALPCPVCQGSIARDYNTENTLYFSNPAATPRARKNITIRTSTNGGESWPYAKTVYEGPSGYSNLIILNTGQIGILYEAGKKDLAEGIAFRTFSKEELLVPCDKSQDKTSK